MSLQKYEAFLKIVECDSFTEAANQLGYSQPGISHMMSSLENEFGVPLIIRDRSGVYLTSEGQMLLPMIQGICKIQSRLDRKLDDLRGMEAGLIRVGTFASVATNWLPAVIKKFSEIYPKIDFEVLYGDYLTIENWILKGRVDCGFLRYPTNTMLQSFFLAQDKLVVILPEDHPYADCTFFPLEKLHQERFILLEEGLENEILEIFAEQKINPKICFRAWDNQIIISMVENGLGISILPELTLRRTPYRILKKELSKKYSRKICISLRNIKYAATATKHFIEYIQKAELE